MIDPCVHIVFRWLIDSPIFSLRSIEHTGRRCDSHGRSGAGGNSEGEHSGAQRRRSSDSTTAHGRRQHRAGFPRGQCTIIRPQFDLSMSIRTKLLLTFTFDRHRLSREFLKRSGGRITNAEITNSLIRDITLIQSIYLRRSSFCDKMNSAAISALIDNVVWRSIIRSWE